MKAIEKFEQELKDCNFECTGGPLEYHQSYIALLAAAKRLQTENLTYRTALSIIKNTRTVTGPVDEKLAAILNIKMIAKRALKRGRE